MSSRRLFALNRPEFPHMALGIVSSAAVGSAMPIMAVIMGEVAALMIEDIEYARDKSIDYALMFVGLGIMVGIAMLVQNWMFGISGARLTLRMRRWTMEAMLRQEIGWFDDDRNSTGALTSRLSADAAAVQAVRTEGGRFEVKDFF